MYGRIISFVGKFVLNRSITDQYNLLVVRHLPCMIHHAWSSLAGWLPRHPPSNLMPVVSIRVGVASSVVIPRHEVVVQQEQVPRHNRHPDKKRSHRRLPARVLDGQGKQFVESKESHDAPDCGVGG